MAQHTHVTGGKGTLSLRYNEIHCEINKFDVGCGVFYRVGKEVWRINGWPDEVLRVKVRLLRCCSCWYLMLDWGRVTFGEIRWRIQTRPNNYLISGRCLSR